MEREIEDSHKICLLLEATRTYFLNQFILEANIQIKNFRGVQTLNFTLNFINSWDSEGNYTYLTHCEA